MATGKGVFFLFFIQFSLHFCFFFTARSHRHAFANISLLFFVFFVLAAEAPGWARLKKIGKNEIGAL